MCDVGGGWCSGVATLVVAGVGVRGRHKMSGKVIPLSARPRKNGWSVRGDGKELRVLNKRGWL